MDWSVFNDRIVLVGTTAPGLNDLRATPIAEAFPGVEVHATLLAGALDKRVLTRLPEGNLITALAILLIGGLFSFAAPRAGAFGVIIATCTGAARDLQRSELSLGQTLRCADLCLLTPNHERTSGHQYVPGSTLHSWCCILC